MIARRAVVTGRVQGVWFRDWTVETAQALGVTGWVRNRADGSVEVHAAGAIEAVERLLAQLQEGPPAARVARIEVTEAEPGAEQGFHRRPTA